MGWAPGARSAGTWFGMHHRGTIGRVAIIAGDRWADEVLRISDIFKAATVRQFTPQERVAAMAWLTARLIAEQLLRVACSRTSRFSSGRTF